MNGPSGLVLYIFMANFVGSTVAFAVNLYGARNAFRPWNYLFAAIAALALFYSASYMWVISGHITIAHWSQKMRYVSLTAWTLVWWTPVSMFVWRLRHYEQHLVERTVEAVIVAFDAEATNAA